MKKVLFTLFAVTALAVVPASFAQRAVKPSDADKPEAPATAESAPAAPERPANPMERIRENFEKSKNENGDVQIEKAADLMAEDLVKMLKDADKDNDGTVTKEEIESIRFFGRPGPGGPRGPEGRSGRRGGRRNADGDRDNRGPRRGDRGDRGPTFDPLADARTEDGQIDLSKLPERMPEEARNRFKEADTDGNGLLDADEQATMFNRRNRADRGEGRPGNRAGNREGRGPRRGPNGGGNAGPRGPFGPMGVVFSAIEKVRTEDGGEIKLDELTAEVRQAQIEFLQTADSNGDGLLTEEELKAFAPPRPQGPFGMPPQGADNLPPAEADEQAPAETE
ncbi:MAG: hypothetical protein J6S40_05360 [Thermoguttaceae bacterium]|nr:hypothetical protein [Thermoguttaceae bacterium]